MTLSQFTHKLSKKRAKFSNLTLPPNPPCPMTFPLDPNDRNGCFENPNPAAAFSHPKLPRNHGMIYDPVNLISRVVRPIRTLISVKKYRFVQFGSSTARGLLVVVVVGGQKLGPGINVYICIYNLLLATWRCSKSRNRKKKYQ